jgi:hypothetical protein
MSSACRNGSGDRGRPRGPSFGRGDRVVVEPVGGEFFEGRVLEVFAERLKIERGPSGETSKVAPGDVYRLPATAVQAEPGRLGICKVDAEWIGCRVEGVTGAELAVTTLERKTLSLPRASVLAPSSVTELNLKQRFERQRVRARFAEEAERAGEPVVTPQYRPLPNTRVVAKRQDQWWSAIVLGVDDDEILVRFSSDGLERELSATELVSEPIPGPMPARGLFVLSRPSSPSEAWQRVRVLGGAGVEVRVEEPDGGHRSVGLRDILTLVPR